MNFDLLTRHCHQALEIGSENLCLLSWLFTTNEQNFGKKIDDGSMRLTEQGNRIIYETSSNLDCGSCHLLCTNALGKGMEPLLPPQTMSK